MLMHPLAQAAQRGALVLLYHSVGDNSLGDNSRACDSRGELASQRGLHHVRLHDFTQHLAQVARYFTFVSVDDLLTVDCVRGQAAVCFDDGHINVFRHALPVLAARGIPATCFINGASFHGQMLWREKLRYLLSLGWEEELAHSLRHARLNNPANKRLYRYSKLPSNDSRMVAGALDDFVQQNNIALPPSAILQDVHRYASCANITWGNHSQHHYVLSSLDEAAQQSELVATANILQQYQLPTSAVFAVPFGGTADANRATFNTVAALGMRGIAFSRNQLHTGAKDKKTNLVIMERLMPRTTDIADALDLA